ncbi:MAG: DUF501 domain-containing protein [Actinomycetaceae bacterium]|nr:DUF501 domain-containing protein [Actinomycetaceae bacterium]MDY6083554.1 DUF501 domain-containing protein [Actinomycetaceae bacterium]
MVEEIRSDILAGVAQNATAVDADDERIVTAQLGRRPRGFVGVGARCVCGAPLVTITAPRLPDGTPFPTLFYLTQPWLVKEMSRLESTGVMAQFTRDLGSDDELALNHRSAHMDYVARRALLGDVPEISGVSAGGMPDRVKCLHALAAYALSAGSGVCVVGDRALSMAGWDATECHCAADQRGSRGVALKG